MNWRGCSLWPCLIAAVGYSRNLSLQDYWPSFRGCGCGGCLAIFLAVLVVVRLIHGCDILRSADLQYDSRLSSFGWGQRIAGLHFDNYRETWIEAGVSRLECGWSLSVRMGNVGESGEVGDCWGVGGWLVVGVVLEGLSGLGLRIIGWEASSFLIRWE